MQGYWMPILYPFKTVMLVGTALLLLQAGRKPESREKGAPFWESAGAFGLFEYARETGHSVEPAAVKADAAHNRAPGHRNAHPEDGTDRQPGDLGWRPVCGH